MDGVNLANVVGTIELTAPPGEAPHLVMQLVPTEVLVVETAADIEFKCVACGRPMEKPDVE